MLPQSTVSRSWFPKPRARFRRAIITLFTVGLCYYLFEIGPFGHGLWGQDDAWQVGFPRRNQKRVSLSLPEAEELCGAHNFTVFPATDQTRKVYDLFLLGTELDWLEIRLNELHNEVDYFVIVESTRTFTNCLTNFRIFFGS